MLTCCPACATTFRVTPEQLKIKAGTVRCGKCQAVFNALDTLAEASGTHPEHIVEAESTTLPPVDNPLLPDSPADLPDSGEPICPASAEGIHDGNPDTAPETAHLPDNDKNNDNFAKKEDIFYISSAKETNDEFADANLPEASPPPLPAEPSPAAVRDDALAVGLVAARDTSEMPGYSKWAEGAFTGENSIAEPLARPLWPFAIIASLLLLVFTGQLAYHFRSELSAVSPGLRSLLTSTCQTLGCTIPLPRNAELVSIESSDLQVDASRNGMILLSATLQNRAAYAQSWPWLEITLTDTQDKVVLRRVLQAAEYLPQKFDPAAFPAHGEAGIHLWLEAQGITAAGYRLYVFYP